MATRTLRTLAIYRQECKEGGIVNKGPGEDASQTWKEGAPLVEDSSSKEFKIWPGGSDTGKITGIAVGDATGVTGADVSYYEANDYNIFQGSIINNTSAIALATSHINTVYSLIASSGAWYIDIADTTTARKVKIIAPIDAIGDENARVAFRFATDKQAKVSAA